MAGVLKATVVLVALLLVTLTFNGVQYKTL